MGILSAAMRANLPQSQFAGKGETFPVPDKKHAKAAIMDSKFAPPSERAEIKAKAKRVLKGGQP
jgi:hypothetical protein